MGGIIDFDTACPWQLYLFSTLHMLGGLLMFPIDVCKLFTGVACVESEVVMQRMMALSMVYVGGLYGMLTYHNKDKPAKITRLSNIALNAAIALLVSVVFIGNSKYGGFEKSWMHVGDMWTALIIAFVLADRVSQKDAEWAQKIPVKEGLGANCKTLVLIFTVLAVVKFLALADYIDPSKLMSEGLEITAFASWTWKFIIVLVFESFLAMFFTLLFEDDSGHELLVKTIIVLTLFVAGAFYSMQQYLSGWMGLNGNALWTRLGVMVAVCLLAIVAGRHTGPSREGYENVAN
mmetsp:Transcript_27340/g.39156  ORF Transcript_27340/g.39156 Transcript_27340/m.39156 type:complete len:291 (+) Transcript_27340:381-1253(+)|eukprot:CAMPEP_0201691134 /NCGR_PEP_ID=MMETSP0578-20130828/4384_1 /ASSEMBLY_ACC=CAM_ASM_000663 /TAXON_ID=267565 /ORGANISM="Skeletonema grethea, Strain CCMP 1804" /LENGTH=290 /DNA_ID=CAMNT_0048176287 /DNA_START=295 /DNA_END=1167 /DNA_ORIENTATION=+